MTLVEAPVLPFVPQLYDTGVPRRTLLLGVLGSLLVAIGGVAAGATPQVKDAVAALLHLEVVQQSVVGRTLGLAVVVLGVAMLGTAWWHVGQLLDRLPVRSLVVVAVLWALPLLVAPPLFSRDLYAYAGQGHLVANGYDPYTFGPGALSGKWAMGVDAPWRYSASPYGPVYLWLAGAVVRLVGDHVVPAVVLLRLLSASGLVLVAWGLPRLARAHGVAPQRALWLGLANPFVLLHVVGGGHNDALMIGLLVAGLALLVGQPTTSRLVAATALITLAALVKLPALAALGFVPLVVAQGWRPRLRVAAVVGSTAAVTSIALTLATGLGWGWVRTLSGGNGHLSMFSPVTGLGVLLARLLRSAGLVQDRQAVLDVVFLAGLAVAGAAVLYLLSRADELGLPQALGCALLAVVVLLPGVQPWYLLWGLVLLAACSSPQVLTGLAALSLTVCALVLPNGNNVVPKPLYGVPVLLCAAVAVARARRQPRRLAPA